jgi:hypothetical protein
MITKKPLQDEGDYKEQIEKQYKKATESLEKLRPKEINAKLGDFVGVKLALVELRRIALNEPKLYA